MKAYYKLQFEQLTQWVATDDNTSIVVKENGNRISIEVNPFPMHRPPEGDIQMIERIDFLTQVLQANLSVAKAITE